MSLDYLAYLKQRSRLGAFYRQYFLYPKLNAVIKGKALDLGCGIGDFITFRPNTIGVDVNSEIVTWCKGQGLSVSHMKQDELPFPENSFDSVVMDNVLEHIENPEKILEEVQRVLRPQGVFLVGVPGIKGYSSDPDHKVFYDEALLAQTIESAGFSYEKQFSMPLSIPYIDRIMRQFCIYGVFRK